MKKRPKKHKEKSENAISEINNTLEGKNSRVDEAEDHTSDLGGRAEKNTQVAKRKKNLTKSGELKKHFGQHEV